MNCFVNNGGCSHYCNSQEDRCECPQCWELEDDQLTCQPSDSKLELVCSSDSIEVNVDQCIFQASLGDELTIGFDNDVDGFGGVSDDCTTQSVSDEGIHTLSTKLDGCGTVIDESVDTLLSFVNTITGESAII